MPDDPRAQPSTLDLLRRWREGDKVALDQLLSEVHPWLHREISKALGSRPRGAQESIDVAQDAIVNFLRWGPRYVPETEAQFRALLKRIAMNQVIDVQRRQGRRDRGGHLESMRPSGASYSGFAPPVPSVDGPSREAQRGEDQSWVRLALQFLEEEERYLLIASEVEGLDWATIAEELGLPSADTARMRCARLKPKVARLLLQLRGNRYPEQV